MKKHYFFFWAAVLAAVLAINGCEYASSEKTTESRVITLMSWNVHNLFDGKDDGFEYPEYKTASGWSAEKYRGRINNISAAICKIEPMPDVLILQEIESLTVIGDIALSLPQGYSFMHFANNPGSGIGVGILSRFPLSESRTHSITIDSATTPRPILEARVNTESGSFIIFACHWKSKIGGDAATEEVRMASARVILRRIRHYLEYEPETGIIVAGDLNENHDEFQKLGSGTICALLPDDPKSAQIAGDQNDFIVISGNMPPLPVNFPPETIVLYSPWVRELEYGSYYYRGSWETIDHFLISHQFFDSSGLRYIGSLVIDSEPFANRNGIPVPYSLRTGNGLSDHLPILMSLRY